MANMIGCVFGLKPEFSITFLSKGPHLVETAKKTRMMKVRFRV